MGMLSFHRKTPHFPVSSIPLSWTPKSSADLAHIPNARILEEKLTIRGLCSYNNKLQEMCLDPGSDQTIIKGTLGQLGKPAHGVFDAAKNLCLALLTVILHCGYKENVLKYSKVSVHSLLPTGPAKHTLRRRTLTRTPRLPHPGGGATRHTAPRALWAFQLSSQNLDMYTLLCLQWITNKGLLCGAGALRRAARGSCDGWDGTHAHRVAEPLLSAWDLTTLLISHRLCAQAQPRPPCLRRRDCSPPGLRP